MGSCMCHPLTDVEQDPTVSCHANVEDIVFFSGNFPIYQVLGCCTGIMYVKDNVLFYNMKCGTSLCCTCYGRKRTNLGDIHSIEVVTNDIVRFWGHKYVHEIVLAPGLKITLKNGNVVLVGCSDAVVFAQELQRACQNLPVQY